MPPSEAYLTPTAQDLSDLLRAKQILEHPGLAAKFSNLIGKPVEAGIKSLPAPVHRTIVEVTRSALRVGLGAMVSTLDPSPGKPASPRLYQIAGGLSGAAGGFFGLIALPLELPVSTLLILRSIAEMARSQGEDLNQPEAQLACLEVLALGGDSSDDDAGETGYYATRIGLAQSVASATQYLSGHGVVRKLATPLASLISRVAARFSVRVTESMAAKAVPLLGAASGAAINTLFMTHFQDMAWAHFTVRRLERRYGGSMVKQRYLSLLPYNVLEMPIDEARP
jgi:EcsC protein family